MAEIKIEKKKPIWPWIVLLLIVAALVYYIFVQDHEPRTESGTPIENSSSAQ